MSDLLRTPLSALTPMNPEVLACPHEFNERLRREAPVYQCPHTGITFVSDYQTITRIARDHQTFSNRVGTAMPSSESKADARILEIQARGYPPVDTMLTQDPPLHRRYRGMVNQAFTARRVTTLAPSIEKLCHNLIDGFMDKGRCEFVQAFAERVPLTVIAEQLGVPLSDYQLFKSWSDAFVAQLSQMASADESVAATQLILDYQNYFAARIEERRGHPEDDIISDIVHARFEDERPLDTAEMLSIIQQLLVAGNETTTHAIAEGILLLCQHPDQHALLKNDVSLVPNFVEEILRLATPTANMWRVVTKNTEIKGVPVKAGAMVQIRFSSANRDENSSTHRRRSTSPGTTPKSTSLSVMVCTCASARTWPAKKWKWRSGCYSIDSTISCWTAKKQNCSIHPTCCCVVSPDCPSASAPGWLETRTALTMFISGKR